MLKYSDRQHLQKLLGGAILNCEHVCPIGSQVSQKLVQDTISTIHTFVNANRVPCCNIVLYICAVEYYIYTANIQI